MKQFFVTETVDGLSIMINFQQICTIEAVKDNETLCRITFAANSHEPLLIKSNYNELVPLIALIPQYYQSVNSNPQ